MVNERIEVFVRLLDEGTEVLRPTSATALGELGYWLHETLDHDADETWEFPPNCVVSLSSVDDHLVVSGVIPSLNYRALIWALGELADRDLQRSLWLGKIKGEQGSFEEAVAQLFMDSRFDEFHENDELAARLPDECVADVLAISALVRRIPKDYGPEQIIESAEMSEIRQLAARAQNNLLSVPGLAQITV